MSNTFSAAVSGGTPGADANTYKLFDSTIAFSAARMMRMCNISRAVFTLQNSQAGTLNAYWSNDGGTTWRLYDARAVAIPAASTSSGPFDYYVEAYRDWKLEWVNGGVAQATWAPELELVEGDRAAAI